VIGVDQDGDGIVRELAGFPGVELLEVEILELLGFLGIVVQSEGIEDAQDIGWGIAGGEKGLE